MYFPSQKKLIHIVQQKNRTYKLHLTQNKSFLELTVKAHSHEEEIINETSNDKSAQRQTRRRFIHTTSGSRNVAKNWRFFLAHHQSGFA